ncbi:ABC transporter permease [Halorussus gelatinilyticus]|uniref:ABC transporter permease n=1 Tax=Halorussus gelatinilyticus TaxID=2937524 RepID=A0A8U0INI1_9EURY|nr:ABC transporter permease subunit [Halorussus gelatinilyticus]UPW02012.1 ABC transporter permease [Halorussus gelatinilyticus]
MSRADVFRRDLTSVYRSRTGAAVSAIVALATVVAVGLFALASDVALLGGVGGLAAIASILALVFLGNPKQIAGVVVGFAALAVVATLALSDPRSGAARPNMELAVTAVGSALSVLLPLVCLVGSYAALVGERETGSVRFLLGLPNSRDDAYVGKYLSRATVVLVPLVVSLLLTGVVVALTFRNGSFLGMVGLTLVSIPYALLFVGIGLTASAYADTSNRSVAVVVAAFTVLRAGWPALQFLLLSGVEDTYPKPEWYFWVGRLNPINAYVKLTTLFADVSHHPLITTPADSVSTVATTYPFAAVVLLGWTVLAPLAGLVYFRNRDLL